MDRVEFQYNRVGERVWKGETIWEKDKNGNMMKLPKPDVWNAAFTCVYDAWNRMVQVKDGTTVVASYAYNGLNHRVKKIVGSETRLFYFNQNWQCLEERIGTTTDTQYVWGLRYIDDLVCRDKGSVRLYSIADPNWNVGALCDTSGTVKERYIYSSFGKATVLNASFASQSPTTYSWNRLFTGQVFDTESGLMLYRNRFYHSGLGRFVQRDPIGYWASDSNVYRYAFNNPFVYADAFGLDYIQTEYQDSWPIVPSPTPALPILFLPPVELSLLELPPVADYSPILFPPAFDLSLQISPMPKPEPPMQCWYDYRTNGTNTWYPQHVYIRCGSLDKYGKPHIGTEGIGIAGNQRKGCPPKNTESSFRPEYTYMLCKTKCRKLKYGSGAGKSGEDASDSEIMDCLKSYPASSDYNSFTYNCRTWANEALAGCGLEFCFGNYYDSLHWFLEPPNWTPSLP